jgi:uncharacterized protein (TIGR03032 family)
MSFEPSAPSKSLQVLASPELGAWLQQENIALAFTTYQSNRLILVGHQTDGQISWQESLFDKPMGLFAQDNLLLLATRYQIWQFENFLQPSETYQGSDRLYVPCRSYTTGSLNVHDVALDNAGKLLFVNTDFSCLATRQRGYSFQPLWQPPFISQLVSEDRCHLNGLALVKGQPTYMSACGESDKAAGWRKQRQKGGIILHLPTGETVARGLSMPHSPRWYQEKLWLLNSGTGELGYLDGEAFIPLSFCPGFGRGLAFWQNWAIAGLSKLRSHSFSGLHLEERLQSLRQSPQCGLMVIDLHNSQIVHSLRLEGIVEELYDVVVLPGVARPRGVDFQGEDIERLVRFPAHPHLVVTKPTVKAISPAEAPRRATSLKLQRVYHLNPTSLLAYESLTYPSLRQRWLAQPPRGELIGIAASLGGAIVGLVIAEQLSPIQVEVISLLVESPWRHQGIGTRLLATLEKQLRQENIHQLTLVYEAHPAIAAALEPLLRKLGWQAPVKVSPQTNLTQKSLS